MGWGGNTATTTTVNRPVGNLVVDIFTTTDKKLIWRGSLERDVSSKAEENISGLDKDIDKMFKDFPPKSSGGSSSGAQ